MAVLLGHPFLRDEVYIQGFLGEILCLYEAYNLQHGCKFKLGINIMRSVRYEKKIPLNVCVILHKWEFGRT